MVFQRKSNASPINLWNKILGQSKMRVFTTENICGTRVIYDLWTCSCVDEYKREVRQHLKLWRKIRPFSASLNTKNEFRFHSGKFSKGKAISLCENVLWTSWLQHFPHVRICLLLPLHIPCYWPSSQNKNTRPFRRNRPFTHYAPVNKHKEMRTRLGRTISYKSLYFVCPSLELVPLFTGMRERSICLVFQFN